MGKSFYRAEKQRPDAGNGSLRGSSRAALCLLLGWQISCPRFVLIPCLIVGLLLGCAPKYGVRDPDQQHAMRTLAGGAAGILIAGNTGGAIVGAFVMDMVSVATISYEDRLLENGEQAARRYKDLEQKAEEKKPTDQKAEEQDLKDRKAEEKREREKKAEQKLPERQRVKLIIEDSSITSHTVRSGAVVKADIQYTLLGPQNMEKIRITETRRLRTAYQTVELDTREIVRTQGTYKSSIQFKLPDDIPRGYCVLYTTVSDGREVKTAQSVMNVY